LGEIQFPSDWIIASVQRGRKVLIPHGSTRLNAGDVIIAVAGEDARAEFARLCRR
jgi:Trk K+ transport system NAD-binding subunit